MRTLHTLFKTQLLLALWVVVPLFALAQPLGHRLQKLSTQESHLRWIKFTRPLDISPEDFFRQYGGELGLTEDDQMTRIKYWESYGIAYETFQQRHKGIFIQGATLIVQISEGKIRAIQGDVARNLRIPTDESITESEARKLAAQHLGGVREEYLGPIEGEEEKIEAGEKIIVTSEPNKVFSQEGLHAAYKFHLHKADNGEGYHVFVDMGTGKIIRCQESAQYCRNQTGTVHTPFNNAQSFETRKAWEPFWTHFRLNIDCGGYNIETKKLDGTHFKDSDNIWGSPTSFHEEAGAHWAVQKAWDYFKDEFGVESTDGSSGKIRVKVGVSFPPSGGAYSYSGNEIRIAAATPFTQDDCDAGLLSFTPVSWASLDLIAHEYTHGVIENLGSLGSVDEAGALNEGFADIFGAMVERSIGATSSEIWMTFQDPVGMSNNYPRSFATPNDFHWRLDDDGCRAQGIADEYMQTGFWAPAVDKHANSGPISHWFYLMVTGSTHRNGSTVTAIGFENASLIAYHTMRGLTAAATYSDARTFAVDFAEMHFGTCSPEHISTIEAFNAIQVDNAPVPTQTIVPEITGGPTSLCTNATATYEVADVPFATYNWSVSGSLQIISTNGRFCTVRKISGPSGVIDVKVSTACGEGEDDLAISSNPFPTPTTPTIVVDQFPVCFGNIFDVRVSNPQSGVTYTWSCNPAGNLTFFPTTGSSVFASADVAGLVTIIATPSNSCGSGTPGTRQINVFTKGEKQDCSDIFERIAGQNGFSVTPNPVQDRLVLNYPEGSEVVITDIRGKKIKVVQLLEVGQLHKIDVSDMLRGIYFVQVLNQGKEVIWAEKVLVN